MNDFATDNRVDSGVETSNDSNDSGATRTNNNSNVSMLANPSIICTDSFDNLDSSSSVQSLLSTSEDSGTITDEARCTIEEIDQPGSSLSADAIDTMCDTIKSSCYRLNRKYENLLEEQCDILRLGRKFRHRNRRYTRLEPYAPRCKEKYYRWGPTRRHFGESELGIAATTNNIELLTRLLHTGTSPNCKDVLKMTPLHIASKLGYTEIVNTLLQHGADANCRNCADETPLHAAASAGHLSIVKLLLSTDTDLLAIDNRGFNPLQLAAMRLELLQFYRQADVMNMKTEANNIVKILLTCLESRRGCDRQVEALSNVCSRLSLSNTTDQVQDELRDLLSNIDALRLKS